MDRLYRYFLWLIKQGYQLFDAIARASVKFADVPAKQVYNVAVSAFASRAAGIWMESNPNSFLSTIVQKTGGTDLVYGRQYSQTELLDLFPKVVGPPYQFIGATHIDSPSIGGYRTYSTFIGDDSYYHKVIEGAGLLWDYKYKLVGGRLVFVSKFIVGRPILVDY